MNIEERLREKSNTLIDCWLATDYDNTDMEIIKLTDAIEITKDLFTKEQVEELLKKQREICAKHYAEHYGADDCMADVSIIENAPSPSLEGEKK